jgi:hypothetical protein
VTFDFRHRKLAVLTHSLFFTLSQGFRAKEARDVSDMSSSSVARSNSPSSNDSSNALHNDALNNSSLNRNVLAHKSAMNDKQGAKGNGNELKDDVNGEKVTRNNANARLSR